jgi:trans-aconitate methyltransferase
MDGARDENPQKQWDAASYDRSSSFVWTLGGALIELLDPKPGERILDLGSGTGHLTNRIAQAGASVVGLDNSAEMIRVASSNYPGLRFELGDGASFSFDEPFDAVFSNAAIHWMSPPSGVARSIFNALKVGGRFVAEFGAKGNLARTHRAITSTIRNAGYPVDDAAWVRYYATLGEYATLLEAQGFVVTYGLRFERPTPLEGGADGLRNWMRVFADGFFARVPVTQQEAIIREIEDRLRPHLFSAGTWRADYCRLRVAAERPSPEDDFHTRASVRGRG